MNQKPQGHIAPYEPVSESLQCVRLRDNESEKSPHLDHGTDYAGYTRLDWLLLSLISANPRI